jgi:anti-anti-sigma regulatory factor
MLRVSPLEGDHGTYRLHVEGRLAGTPALEVFSNELAEAEASGRRVVVELSGLRFADEAAVVVLAGAAARGVTLCGSSPWLVSRLDATRP